MNGFLEPFWDRLGRECPGGVAILGTVWPSVGPEPIQK